MIPITRKENYLNEIVGWGETAPEKPLTPEEFFFAAILGEAVQAPEPLTRYQMYLAKIAGRNIEIPYPETRLEYFLAKACGMDIETPTPITREEIFWSNYSAIVDFEVEGVPPLTYKAIEGTLENYRIYGNTVGGESVGDKTGNLFDKSGSQYRNNLHWVPTFSLVYSDTYYGSPIMDVTGLNTITRSYTGTGANYFSTSDLSQFVNISNIGTVDAGVTVNVPDGYTKYVFNIPNTIRPDSIMVNSGSTALPYEPYGYKVPVTVEGKNLLNFPHWANNVYVVRGTKIINGNSIAITSTAATCFTGWNTTEYPLDSKIPVAEGEHITFTWDTDANDASSVWIFPNATSGASVHTASANKKLEYTVPAGVSFITFRLDVSTANKTITYSNLMITKEDAATTYEPYQPPVTTPIYLPEQIKMVGDEAEYIDYGEQKQHRVGADDIDVALPALPTLEGTNVLTVGTAVQPSKVYVKYKGERQ